MQNRRTENAALFLAGTKHNNNNQIMKIAMRRRRRKSRRTDNKRRILLSQKIIVIVIIIICIIIIFFLPFICQTQLNYVVDKTVVRVFRSGMVVHLEKLISFYTLYWTNVSIQETPATISISLFIRLHRNWKPYYFKSILNKSIKSAIIFHDQSARIIFQPLY